MTNTSEDGHDLDRPSLPAHDKGRQKPVFSEGKKRKWYKQKKTCPKEDRPRVGNHKSPSSLLTLFVLHLRISLFFLYHPSRRSGAH